MQFDVRTLYLSASILSLIFFLSMFVVSSNNRNRYRGIYEWITSIGMITLSTTLITLRGEISNVFSVFISNVLVFLAFMLFLKGFARFMHIKQHLVAHMSVATVLAFCFAYFTFVNESLGARNFIAGIGGVYTFGYMLINMYKRVPVYYLKMMRLLEVTSWIFIIISLTRIVFVFVLPNRNNDIFANQTADVFAAILMIVFTALLPISFLIFVNNRTLDEISVEELKFENAFYDSPVIILITRLSNGMIYDVNKAFTQVLGFERDEVIGKTTTEINIWISPAARAEALKKLETADKIDAVELTFYSKTKQEVDTVYSSRVIDMLGEKFIISLANDVTQLGDAKKKLIYMATHDALTGLLNRHELANNFKKLVENHKKTNEAFAIVILDLDKFKPINDTYGHDFGDQVLIKVAEFLKTIFKNNCVSRLGGDEFIIIVKDDIRESKIADKMNKTRDTIVGFTSLEGNEISLGVSLGYAIFPDHGETLEELIRHGDKELYIEKNNKKNSN